MGSVHLRLHRVSSKKQRLRLVKNSGLIAPCFPLAIGKTVAWFLQDSLAEVEEKYKKAMVSNAQLDNEKTNFMYQVDTLKDTLLELEEQLAESQRLYEEKNKVSTAVLRNAAGTV